MPEVGGILGLGELALDAVLLLTTGGIGNLAKAGLKSLAKVVVKETIRNYASGEISEGLEEQGVPFWLQLTLGMTLGIKPGEANKLRGIAGSFKSLTNKQAKEIAKGYGFKSLTESGIPKEVLKQTGKNPVFYDKKTRKYFSPDRAGHRADYAWKRFDSKGNRKTGIFVNGKFEVVSK